jgi:hypothetical protein
MALLPEGFVRCCAKASGLAAGGQYGGGVRIFLLPLWEKVARTKSVPDEGLRSTDRPCPLIRPDFRYAHSGHLLPRGEKGRRNYTDAVVTPPSTTMVCPVMKLEASEPR